VREQNLRVAGYPRIEPKADAAEGMLGFTAVFEVYPDISPGRRRRARSRSRC
jgi:trigger factor